MAVNTYKRNETERSNEVKATNRLKGETEKAVKAPKAPKPPKEKKERKPFPWHKLRISFVKDRRFQLFAGFFFLLASLYLTIAFVSYLFTGPADQTVIEAVQATGVKESGLEAENWLGLVGAWVANLFIFEWFGIGAFAFIPILFFLGYRIVFRRVLFPLSNVLLFCLFTALWVSLAMGYVVYRTGTVESLSYLSGGIGYETALFSESLVGWGTIPFLGFLLLSFIVVFFNITSISLPRAAAAEEVAAAAPERIPGMNVRSAENGFSDFSDHDLTDQEDEDGLPFSPDDEEEELVMHTRPAVPEPGPVLADEEPATAPMLFNPVPVVHLNVPAHPMQPAATLPKMAPLGPELELDLSFPAEEETDGLELEVLVPSAETAGPEPETALTALTEAPLSTEELGLYDPTLDLARYQYPTLELLNDYGPAKTQVSKEELEANKDRIVETLGHYGISIASIKATIGPTVTLYEIVPEAGVRISKIKSLEDDIALSLAALGIRIIAPIPGKGTIGIEVPNNQEGDGEHPLGAGHREVLPSTEMDLPIAFGRTITNEVFVADLAKMPHLLMAGATGQGKSVGLNVILASLLYKRHPSQLKFVLVDPKKVELSIFNKIERHFLAKLPDTEEAIITDTKKVVNTLNSLCMEMDRRYDLLKDAGCRNLKEYNRKFVERRLNPKKGHRFMPFIVLVIDELADLMMTAGKEVETPIARLAQLARAIGIHLIVATQRPIGKRDYGYHQGQLPVPGFPLK